MLPSVGRVHMEGGYLWGVWIYSNYLRSPQECNNDLIWFQNTLKWRKDSFVFYDWVQMKPYQLSVITDAILPKFLCENLLQQLQHSFEHTLRYSESATLISASDKGVWSIAPKAISMTGKLFSNPSGAYPTKLLPSTNFPIIHTFVKYSYKYVHFFTNLWKMNPTKFFLMNFCKPKLAYFGRYWLKMILVG
jgi:hypothetical protein